MKRQLRPRVNFKAYRKARYLLAVCEEYGTTPVFPGQRTQRSACPLCQSGRFGGRSFWWSFENCSFCCFSCKKRGDALQLVQEITGKTVIEAAKWLELRGGESGSGLVSGDGHA